jgi:hypothetical protein
LPFSCRLAEINWSSFCRNYIEINAFQFEWKRLGNKHRISSLYFHQTYT